MLLILLGSIYLSNSYLEGAVAFFYYFFCFQIRGQTGYEEKQAEVFASSNADDRILQTCLKLRSQAFNTVLYTNDKNLANKAMICGIEAFRYVLYGETRYYILV